MKLSCFFDILINFGVLITNMQKLSVLVNYVDVYYIIHEVWYDIGIINDLGY